MISFLDLNHAEELYFVYLSKIEYTCAGECPVGAISEGDIYSIDPEKCIDCGTCAGVCPTGSIEEA